MINYMQSNEKIISNKKIIKDELWLELIERIKNKDYKKNLEYINSLSIEYNIEKKNIIKNFLNFVIRNKKQYVNKDFLLFIENVMHIPDLNIEFMLPHTLIKLNKFFTQNYCI